VNVAGHFFGASAAELRCRCERDGGRQARLPNSAALRDSRRRSGGNQSLA